MSSDHHGEEMPAPLLGSASTAAGSDGHEDTTFYPGAEDPNREEALFIEAAEEAAALAKTSHGIAWEPIYFMLFCIVFGFAASFLITAWRRKEKKAIEERRKSVVSHASSQKQPV